MLDPTPKGKLDVRFSPPARRTDSASAALCKGTDARRQPGGRSGPGHALRALDKQQLWQEGTNLRAWLFTLMHNQHVNDVRRSNRDGGNIDVTEMASVLVANTDPTASRQLRELERGLGLLPLEQREAILLVGLEGCATTRRPRSPAYRSARSARACRAAGRRCGTLWTSRMRRLPSRHRAGGAATPERARRGRVTIADALGPTGLSRGLTGTPVRLRHCRLTASTAKELVFHPCRQGWLTICFCCGFNA